MTWQDKCVAVIDYLQSHFPDVEYRIVFRKSKDQWIYIVESVRNDKGIHTGSAVTWLQVTDADIEQLPIKMLEKCQQRVLEWQKEGLDKVRQQAEELEKARNELDKRLASNKLLAELEKKVSNANLASGADSRDVPAGDSPGTA